MDKTDWMWCCENPKEAAAEIDKLKQVAKQLYYACLSSTGAYDALETIGAHKELPGYEARQA